MRVMMVLRSEVRSLRLWGWRLGEVTAMRLVLWWWGMCMLARSQRV